MANDETSWKRIAYRALLVVFAIGMITSTAAIWADVRLADSDAWARTVGPLADDTTVQAFVVDQATLLFEQQIAADDDAGRLANFSRAQLTSLVRMAINDFVSSPTFATWWTEANRTAHGVVMRTIDNEQGVLLQTYGGDLVLELTPIVTWVNGHLETILPRSGYQIVLSPERSVVVLYSSEALEQVIRVIELVDTLAVVLPIITLAALAGALILARDRVEAIRHLGFALVLGAVIALIAFGFGRSWFIARQDISQQELLDAILRIALVDLLGSFRVLALLGLIVSGIVFALRSRYMQDPRVQAFLRNNREALVIAAVGMAVLALIFTDYPPIWLSVGTLLVIAVGGYYLFRWRKESQLVENQS